MVTFPPTKPLPDFTFTADVIDKPYVSWEAPLCREKVVIGYWLKVGDRRAYFTPEEMKTACRVIELLYPKTSK